MQELRCFYVIMTNLDIKYIYKYYRLSLDDENNIESNSITNQRQIVENYLTSMPDLANKPSVNIIEMITLSLIQCSAKKPARHCS